MRELMKIDDISKKYIFLSIDRAVQCEDCEANGVCNLLGSGKPIKIRTLNNYDENYKIGDYVEVELPNISVSKLSFVVYGMPLLIFIGLILLAYFLGAGNVWSFLIGFFGMSLTYIFLAIYDRKKLKDKYLAEILRKIDYEKIIKK